MTDTRRTPPRARSEKWFRMAADPDARVAQVYLYDPIDSWFGVTAKDFAREWTALDADHIDLFINSPGGDVFDAMAILNVIRRTEAHVVAHIDGIAASAASFIAMGADEVVMGRNSELMIHDASGLCWGPAEDMQKMADDLTRVSENIASVYAEKAGGEPATWRAAMLAETWYSAEEAVTAGLADRVDTDRDKSDVKNSLDLSIFAHAGRADAPAPSFGLTASSEKRRVWERRDDYAQGGVVTLPPDFAAALADGGHKPPAEPVEPTHTQKEGPDPMSDTIKKGLIDRLGITDADATEDTILAAVDEALAERAEPAPRFSPPEGTVLMDADQVEQLRADARAGAEARAQQISDRRAGVVDAAIQDGRVAPARRDHWLAQLAADEEGATEVLASLAPGTIPMAPAGFTGGVDESTDEDAVYAKYWPTTEKEA
ncbi:head maturation protease, ClpP-related [Brachybacterium paraconglomeratum]|uniref:head maturation protease, ClpP-related n=1 Tax=Brachybacterium paraconglomeratum TaxID=173362 RepID=UPI00026C7003|nr:head maturation protease, ClpP-related [Brachybacterium paraconglomeratum]